ncbi:hypothetical protein CRM22_002192 [Opisthorchis felineus]|uniref:Uncharacterized protein n=1 Tax=Opisthorchis felineus TaxID=147828 RepID=A0A4S2MBN0_OPIFE|nr:hypothetical protein CRM22_002192 [Opisthorchis felineus]
MCCFDLSTVPGCTAAIAACPSLISLLSTPSSRPLKEKLSLPLPAASYQYQDFRLRFTATTTMGQVLEGIKVQRTGFALSWTLSERTDKNSCMLLDVDALLGCCFVHSPTGKPGEQTSKIDLNDWSTSEDRFHGKTLTHIHSAYVGYTLFLALLSQKSSRIALQHKRYIGQCKP